MTESSNQTWSAVCVPFWFTQWTPKAVCLLILRTWESARWHDKADFVDGSEVTDLKLGRACGLFRWTQFNPMSPLKAKNFLRLETGEMRQKGQSDSKCERNSTGHCWLWRWRGPGGQVARAENDLCPRAVKKQSPTTTGTELCQRPEWSLEINSDHHLDLSLGRLWAEKAVIPPAPGILTCRTER